MSRPSFRPRLEVLEDRRLLACKISENAGVLLVLGDNNRNVIEINDGGVATAGSLTLNCDGKVFATAGAISDVRVRAAGGNDSVFYTLTRSLGTGLTRRVKVDLGTGRDRFQGNLLAALGSRSTLDLLVSGGSEASTIRLAARSSVNVPAGATLRARFFAGPGPDLCVVNYQGKLEGNLALAMATGAAFDTAIANLTLTSGSTGLVTGRVSTGDKSDNLRFVVTKSVATDTAGLDARLDGGPDVDFCQRSADVFTAGCESDKVI